MIVDGEVVPRSGAGSLIKIVVRKSVCRGVMSVQVSTSSLWSLSSCPSACIFEDLLQLKCGRLCVSITGSCLSMKGAVNQYGCVVQIFVS
jgi:hypothetical protein